MADDNLNLFPEDIAHAPAEPAAPAKEASSRRKKSAKAYRTISEVADELNVATHVLRFWETRFNDIKPLKRSGGRRYYRPEDVELLQQIRALLYDEGYTIKGVQAYLKRGGAGKTVDLAGQGAADASGADDDFLTKALKELKSIRTLLRGA